MDIDSARRQRRKNESLWRRTKLEVHRQMYLAARDEYNKLIAFTKTNHYRDECQFVVVLLFTHEIRGEAGTATSRRSPLPVVDHRYQSSITATSRRSPLAVVDHRYQSSITATSRRSPLPVVDIRFLFYVTDPVSLPLSLVLPLP